MLKNDSWAFFTVNHLCFVFLHHRSFIITYFSIIKLYLLSAKNICTVDVIQIVVLLAFYIPKKLDLMSFLYTCTYTYSVILLFVPYKKIYMFWYFITVVKCIWLCPLPGIRTQFMIIWWGALFKYWCMWSELPHEFWSFMTYLSFIMPYTRVNPPVLQLYEAICLLVHHSPFTYAEQSR